MQKLIYCPICNYTLRGINASEKSFACRPIAYDKFRTHDFEFDLNSEDEDQIDFLWLTTLDGMMVVFNPTEAIISITPPAAFPARSISLPFFEPDFSDMDALISKLKFYVLMS